MELHKYLQRKKIQKQQLSQHRRGQARQGWSSKRGKKWQAAVRAGARAEGGAFEALPYQQPMALLLPAASRLWKTRIYLRCHLLAFIKLF